MLLNVYVYKEPQGFLENSLIKIIHPCATSLPSWFIPTTELETLSQDYELLHVDVTEWSTAHLVVQLTKGTRFGSPLEVNHGLLRVFICHPRRSNARDGLEAGLGVLHLPQPPQAVEGGVVHPEGRVSGRGIEVLLLRRVSLAT